MSRREEIVEAAVSLVRAEGVQNLSVRAVARAAGVGATTLRHYFPSQAELHQAVASRLITTAYGDADLADPARDPAERLVTVLTQLLPDPDQTATLNASFELYRLAFGPEPHAGARELLRNAHDTTTRVIRRWLSILAVEGHLAEADVDRHAATALALVNGLALEYIVDTGRVDRDAAHASLRWFAERVCGVQPASASTV